jgi:hypothetical protein
MTKRQLVRRTAWVGIALTIVVLAFGVTTRLLTLIPGVTEENVRRIHIGMTAKQVAAILGEPVDDGFPVEVTELPDDETRRIAQRWEALLGEVIDMKDFKEEMPLKKVLSLLQEKLNAKHKAEDVLPIRVDQAAFKIENVDGPALDDTPVRFPPFPRRMSVGLVLRLALSKVWTNNATFWTHRNCLEITTVERQAHCVRTVGGFMLPMSHSRWAVWAESGTAREWSWSEGPLHVVIHFDDNRQVFAINRFVMSGGEQSRGVWPFKPVTGVGF